MLKLFNLIYILRKNYLMQFFYSIYIYIYVFVLYVNMFLAYFPKMIVGLSDHQSVYVSLSVCSPLTTSELLGRF
jgi:hypothetical protein